MFMDIEEPIRFRVLREQFTDTTPTNHPPPAALPRRRQSVADVSATDDLAGNSTKIPPYSLTVSAVTFFFISSLFINLICYSVQFRKMV